MEAAIQEVANYIAQLTAIEKKALYIAKEHLGSSFKLTETIGYQQWKAAAATAATAATAKPS